MARFILETDDPSRRIIREEGSSSSINTGRTMRRTIGVPCGSYRFYRVFSLLKRAAGFL